MKRRIVSTVDWIDSGLAAAVLSRGRERPALLSLFFHGLFESQAEIDGGPVWPAQPLRTEELARVIEYFLESGYSFVSPADILAGLAPEGFHIWLTFDDGYANNQRALPVLRQFSVPATFFVCSGNVAENRSFWWDVVYRQRRRQGVSMAVIRKELEVLKRKPAEAVESWIVEAFGGEARRPIGDTDRPLSVEELRAFAADPLVSIGNHTRSHADLTRCGAVAAAAEIRECQAFLTQVTGATPVALAYPYGRHDAACVALAAAEGLRLAATTRHARARLPLGGPSSLTIPRVFVRCGAELMADCERSRADLQLRSWMEAMLG